MGIEQMKIEILPIESLPKSTSRIANQDLQTEVISLKQLFAQFLEMEVGDGAASTDTVTSYLSQAKIYLDWCKDNLIEPLSVNRNGIRLYRQHLINQNYTVGTIANKLTIINRFYQAAVNRSLIEVNPTVGVKAPKSRIDPAANISYLELDELKLLLQKVESRLDQAKTNKQRLPILRDLILVGIMVLQGCRTVELHQLQVNQVVHQGEKTGLKVFSKRAMRIVPLTKTLSLQLEQYLEMRQRVLRRKLKPDDYVFISLSNNNKGKQLSRRGIRAIVDRYLKLTGLKHKEGRTLTAHSLSLIHISEPTRPY